MATQRRMIYAKMLENKEFGTLSPNAKILYLFSIVLADDEGRLKANAVALRGRVFAFDEKITDKHVRIFLNEIVKKCLITWYKVDNEYFIQHPNWNKYQILRSDRTKKSDIPSPDGNQLATKRGRKEVSKQGSNIESKQSYLKNIPEKDLNEFHARFDCSKKAIISKGEDLFLWCESNGRVKKNYKATLLNALKKDIPERTKPITPTVVGGEVKKPIPTEKPDTPEDMEKRKKNLTKMREELQGLGVLKKVE